MSCNSCGRTARLERLALLITLVLAYEIPTLKDLENALNPNAIVWIRHRNYEQAIGSQHYCEYFEIASPKPPKYAIVQHYKVDSTWKRIFREAYLTPAGKWYGPNWVLKYGNKTLCDMFVWDDRVEKQNTKCDKAYDELCGRKKYNIYNLYCLPAWKIYQQMTFEQGTPTKREKL
ncbi:uncharacterized protein LOC125946944 isoform X2 [Dermacentor silvarum]|uniref:uncharacterized protein LOC125946944 isoform X2 n=1 Tax=Dermacentor silvarum TaxID=543639 RepID=UPI00210086B6|nr:uncharacterized protein LOC125946944 isoform X2 [Dermacentor silvarum]